MKNNIEKENGNMVGAVLVVGAGISGMQSALDLAEMGYKVYILEKSPAIGGTMPMLDKTFPTNDCAMCTLSPKLVECGRHLNIDVLTDARIESVTGEAGNFTITVKQKPRFVDLDKCKGCGECANACPVEIKSEFNQGMGTRKAVHKPYAQAYPNAFAVDKQGISPCRAACPAGVNAQGYIQLIKLGKFKEAWETIYNDLPFPAACGRVCTHPCQTQCHRSKVDEPVNIMNLKRVAADYAYSNVNDLPLPAIAPQRNEKVAVIGAGPAGLSCAYQLVKRGYRVKVFEALPVAGGMMTVGIPEYRLPKKWVQLEVDLLTKMGVEIKYNTRLGRDITVDGLLEEGFKAVFIGIGAHKGTTLNVPGEDLDGVTHGLTFLRKVALGEKVSVGKRVAVIGGGNTAMDCARTAVRLGAEKVMIVYRRTEEEITALPEEIHEAKEEGIEFMMLTSPKAFHGKDRVSKMECLKNKLGEPDSSGRRRPVAIIGSEFKIDVDTVIMAVGQKPDMEGLALSRSRGGTIEADQDTLATAIPGVFAGGDAVTGPKTVIAAVAQGKVAAESIHRYINGQDLKLAREFKIPEEKIAPHRFREGEVPFKEAEQVRLLKADDRKTNFGEVAYAYSMEQARKEAERCLNCGVCSECMECVRACSADAIDHCMQETTSELNVGAIVMCPGFELYNAELKGEYGFGIYDNVITSLQFERMLSASGPYGGHIKRPSDGVTPNKIAFIQCVGSRDIARGNGYCSGVCCMYATKEAMIAKDHEPHLDVSIFYMDIRAYGKDFEKYYNRAKNDYNVNYIRSMISTVKELQQSKNLRLSYRTEDGTLVEDDFDMVVLSAGLKTHEDSVKLAKKLNVKLNQYNFCQPEALTGVITSRPGVYVAGTFCGPKDIPETVMQASAAAGDVSSMLAPVRNTLVSEKEFPPERDTSGEEPRIGVFVCHCGINIGSVVNVPQVVEDIKNAPNVVHAQEGLYVCSQDSQAAMREIILEKNLNRVVVASCTPRTHRPLFQETMRNAGLNPHLFEMANIRDQCSWVHSREPEKATAKAIDLVRAAVYKVALHKPIDAVSVGVVHTALVAGGGVAGMTAALSVAEQGYKVEIVEKSDQLGGMARRIPQGLNGEDIQGFLNKLIDRVTNHPLINVHLNSEINDVSGYMGNFISKLSNGEKIEHGATIIATGAVESKPEEYLYGEDSRVLTQMEFDEKLAAGDQSVKSAKNIVMIQCVGSREDSRPYCSRICCTKSVHMALKVKEKNPDANVYILYRDIRTYSFFEDQYRLARENGVMFVRYSVEQKPSVVKEGDSIKVSLTDPVLGMPLTLSADLLVLASAITPADDNNKLSQLFKLPLNADGFFLEAHMKLRPVDFPAEGVYMCGLSHAPKNIEESINQAKAAAGRAGTILSRDKLESKGVRARVNPDKCAACLTCVRLCPFNAPKINPSTYKAEIEPVTCQGCGTCAGECPNKAIELMGFNDKQQMARVHGMFIQI
ncbi:MAG: NAD(P)-binding protein [Bacillota bacterium]